MTIKELEKELTVALAGKISDEKLSRLVGIRNKVTEIERAAATDFNLPVNMGQIRALLEKIDPAISRLEAGRLRRSR